MQNKCGWNNDWMNICGTFCLFPIFLSQKCCNIFFWYNSSILFKDYFLWKSTHKWNYWAKRQHCYLHLNFPRGKPWDGDYVGTDARNMDKGMWKGARERKEVRKGFVNSQSPLYGSRALVPLGNSRRKYRTYWLLSYPNQRAMKQWCYPPAHQLSWFEECLWR